MTFRAVGANVSLGLTLCLIACSPPIFSPHLRHGHMVLRGSAARLMSWSESAGARGFALDAVAARGAVARDSFQASEGAPLLNMRLERENRRVRRSSIVEVHDLCRRVSRRAHGRARLPRRQCPATGAPVVIVSMDFGVLGPAPDRAIQPGRPTKPTSC